MCKAASYAAGSFGWTSSKIVSYAEPEAGGHADDICRSTPSKPDSSLEGGGGGNRSISPGVSGHVILILRTQTTRCFRYAH